MKKFLASVVLAVCFCVPSFAEIFEASGVGKVPPAVSSPAQAKVLARRGAIVDLQRNLLLRSRYSHPGNFSGVVKGLVITSESWDGKIYTVKGYIKR
ncbi:MAG: hypothetical protein IJU31_06560 [Synergistaceae bacterium]|nr:hypothetical protein [Synergistaceae bacterium]